MAQFFSEGFEGGTNGAAVTVANTSFSSIRHAPTFTTQALVGDMAMRATHSSEASDPSGWVRFSSRGAIYARAYVARDVASQMFPMRLLQESPLALRALLVITSSGQVRGLNQSYGTVTPNSSVTIPLGGYARIEWAVTPTTQQVRLFVGDNIHGTTPDYDSGPVSWSPPGNFDLIQFGNTNGDAGADLRFDEVALDDSTWPGPVELEEPVVTPWHIRTEQGWVSASMHIL